MPFLSLAESNEPNLVRRVLHTLLIMLDTGLDRSVHRTHQTRRVQTRPDMHAHARTCTGTLQNAPGHVVAPPAPLTTALALCANSFTTSPRTAQTPPLARGNAVDDAHSADVRHGYWPLSSPSRPRLCIVFTVIKRSVTALTSPTHARHRQCISAPVDASSTMTSSPPHGLASQL